MPLRLPLSHHPLGPVWPRPADLPTDPGARIVALHAALSERTGVVTRLDLELNDPSVNASAQAAAKGEPQKGTLYLRGGMVAALAATSDPDLATAMVLAHEIGHVARRDTKRLRSALFVASVGGLPGPLLFTLGVGSGNLPLLLFGFWLTPLIFVAAALRATLFERRAEMAADRYAVECLGYPGALIEALVRIDEYESLLTRTWRARRSQARAVSFCGGETAESAILPVASPDLPRSLAELRAAVAQLGAEPPADQSASQRTSARVLESLFASHPSNATRITHLRRFEQAR